MPWVATKKFNYGGHILFPGEFCEPKGFRNDRLIFGNQSLHTAPVEKAHDRWRCDRCGRTFAEEAHLRGHQRVAYIDEQHEPERQVELKRQRDRRTEKALRQETILDVARRAGHNIEDREGVPVITQ